MHENQFIYRDFVQNNPVADQTDQMSMELHGKVYTTVLLFLFLLVFPSCLTLKHGFIRNTGAIEKQLCEGGMKVDSVLSLVRKEKQLLIEKAAVVSSEFPAKNDCNITAKQLNAVFDNLRENLAKDSMLHAMARCTSSRGAVVSLLESADAYNMFFRQNKQIRRSVNRGNAAAQVPKGILNKTQRFLLTPSVRKSVEPPVASQNMTPASLAAVMGFALCRRCDRINEIGYDVLNGLSGFFGNTIGVFNKKPEQTIGPQQLLNIIKPLDIILLKSKTHLTDKFIPGFFGHVAIYTGTRKDLEESGYWNLPDVVRYREQIASGNVFAEGLRSGLQLSSVDQFIDGEVFLIIRLPDPGKAEKAAIYQRIYSNISKKYDFNFDIQSPDKVFCSELIFLVFDQVNWLTHMTVGRTTLTPDEIARSVEVNPGMRFTGLITPAGITENPSPELIFRMMEE